MQALEGIIYWYKSYLTLIIGLIFLLMKITEVLTLAVDTFSFGLMDIVDVTHISN